MNFTPILADQGFAGAFGLMDTFYNDLQSTCSDIFDVLQLFTFTLAFLGLLTIAYKGIMGGSLEGAFGQIVTMGIVCVIMPFFPEWLVEDVRVALSDDMLSSLNMDPIGLFENFGDSFSDLDIDTDTSALTALIVDPLAIIDYIANIIAAFCMIVIGLICYVIFFFAYQVQIMALYVGAAASPIFFGMFLYDQTQKTAVSYFTGLIAVCFWPLGWGIGLMLADALLTIGIDVITLICATLNLAGFGIGVEAIAIFVLVVAVAIWIMFVLFKAPGLIQAAITTGAQIGTAFAGQAVSAAMGGISAGGAVASSVVGMVPGGSTASSAISGATGAVTGVGNQIGGLAAGGGGGGGGEE
ncbi:hypothetical protein [Prosthecobacter sp.]|uniref:hypothetical protein n=1 Tax=Prosthecobacter sp. TaxID=1965333 RepID=UPI003783C28B